jgi:tripartite-type tricarboxylate transporter receptor subunit TctC
MPITKNCPTTRAIERVLSLLGGHVDAVAVSPGEVATHVQAGKLRALAITSAKRSASLPDVPTMVEQGFTNFVTDNMNGVFLPAGAAPALVARLHADILKALATPDLRERLQAQGLEPVGDTPQAFAAYVKQQIAQWTKVIKDAGIKVD